MKKQTDQQAIIESFADLGKTEVSETSTSETYETMKAVFKQYSNKYYSQADFVQSLHKSNPFINKMLHKLVADGVITRIKVGKAYAYKAI